MPWRRMHSQDLSRPPLAAEQRRVELETVVAKLGAAVGWMI
jgi:hypothetical protein